MQIGIRKRMQHSCQNKGTCLSLTLTLIRTCILSLSLSLSLVTLIPILIQTLKFKSKVVQERARPQGQGAFVCACEFWLLYWCFATSFLHFALALSLIQCRQNHHSSPCWKSPLSWSKKQVRGRFPRAGWCTTVLCKDHNQIQGSWCPR